MIRISIIGFGNVGKYVYEALQAAPDMKVCGIVETPNVPVPQGMNDLWITDIKNVRDKGDIDVAVLCLPSRVCPDAAETLLKMGISTVDAYDIHSDIWKEKSRLDAVAKEAGKAAVIAAGWDPGTDSVLRALMEAMAPRGISYVDFGPGMSMGHSVAAKAIEGVENALSMTIPAGAGVHRRMVYVQLKSGADITKVTQMIKADPYFSHDETHVKQVDDITALFDMGHGVRITRKGSCGNTHNQIMEFSMRINNPALTSQVLVSCARAVTKQAPGCYTLIEIPVIDLLPGEREDLVNRLV
ncbi:MAG: diaminopimelate dehydrogenase [Chitinispirillales bacterium]|jgi:diaminopimelate dehydrogenase|nr:diaminopimelate dehydrogenase [Chitinispirillales bacterium]